MDTTQGLVYETMYKASKDGSLTGNNVHKNILNQSLLELFSLPQTT